MGKITYDVPHTNKKIIYEIPQLERHRGARYWLKPWNLWRARRRFLRIDNSNKRRYKFNKAAVANPARTTSFSQLLERDVRQGFRFLILGDTGEGDFSQYALLPTIRAIQPDFIIINGDIAYPAGDIADFDSGFFEIYRNLDIPIWAVPGNHEYYSTNEAQEFYDIFCTDKYRTKWLNYHLKLVPQPGTFWELKEPPVDGDKSIPLVILGVDSGMKGNLDEVGGVAADEMQHQWLAERLQAAEAEGRVVIVLFHIPALTNQAFDEKIHLQTLHRLIAQYACVRLVVTAHQHNYQYYDPETFGRFLDDLAADDPAYTRHSNPHYIVCGGGGATITSTLYDSDGYKTADLFPSPTVWSEYAGRTRRVLDWIFGPKSQLARLWGVAGLGKKSFWTQLRAIFTEGWFQDEDTGVFLNLLLVEVTPDNVIVSPILMSNLADFYLHLLNDTAELAVNLTVPNPHLETLEMVKNNYIKYSLTL